MPHSVGQGQHVAAVHLRVGLVAGCEVQQLEGVAHPLRLSRQGRGADHADQTVVEHDPVGLLETHTRTALVEIVYISVECSSFMFISGHQGNRLMGIYTVCVRVCVHSYRQGSNDQSYGVHPGCDVLSGHQRLAENTQTHTHTYSHTHTNTHKY